MVFLVIDCNIDTGYIYIYIYICVCVCVCLYISFCIYKHFSEKGSVGFIGFSKGPKEQKIYETLLKTHLSSSFLYAIMVIVMLQRNISLFGKLVGIEQIPVAARSKECFCSRSLTGTVGSNHAWSTALSLSLSLFLSCDRSVLSGTDLSVGLITRPEESYRVWCV